MSKVFPPVPWTGQFRSHLTSGPSSEDSNFQSLCLYPNPDHSTPPCIHALNGTKVMIILYITLSLVEQWCVNWSQAVNGPTK